MVQDAAPLYLEGLCSDETKKMIEEHKSNCDECRQFYEMCSAVTENTDLAAPDFDSALPIRNIKKANKRKLAVSWLVTVLALAGVVITVILFSYFGKETLYIYNTENPLSLLVYVSDYARTQYSDDGGLSLVMTKELTTVSIESNSELLFGTYETGRIFKCSIKGFNNGLKCSIDKKILHSDNLERINSESLIDCISRFYEKEGDEWNRITISKTDIDLKSAVKYKYIYSEKSGSLLAPENMTEDAFEEITGDIGQQGFYLISFTDYDEAKDIYEVDGSNIVIFVKQERSKK